MKRCFRCNNTYSSDMFHVRVRICDGCREKNKVKTDENKKQWKFNNPEKVKAYRQKTEEKYADEIKERKKKYKQSQAGRAKTQEYPPNFFTIVIYVVMTSRNTRNHNTRNPKNIKSFYKET